MGNSHSIDIEQNEANSRSEFERFRAKLNERVPIEPN